ncbi:DUF4442 domain-containing protein [Aeromicrobium massiliense]|uniref:DUF4442 domain-containing protein n=1 Tax=Aeromicrobium massiliense TaxID=1464554 RepID=UPI0005775347|nr:DUF4442 domain-containing protein [Aeromicrobium massiliense]
MTPSRLRLAMNTWPTYRFAGVRVEQIAEDWTSVDVRLRVRGLQRNAVGTAFGGTLFAMSDPFLMMMAMNQLGRAYVVWDKQAAIEYVKPGLGTIRGHFELPTDTVEEMRVATKDGDKHLRWFEDVLTDDAGDVVARLRRQLYVRRAR